MMLGESMCMLVYVINKYVRHRANPSAADGDALEMNSLILWPVTTLFRVHYSFVGDVINIVGCCS